jgi:hypothetical protein
MALRYTASGKKAKFVPSPFVATKEQYEFLKTESKKLGITINELIRRYIQEEIDEEYQPVS